MDLFGLWCRCAQGQTGIRRGLGVGRRPDAAHRRANLRAHLCHLHFNDGGYERGRRSDPKPAADRCRALALCNGGTPPSTQAPVASPTPTATSLPLATVSPAVAPDAGTPPLASYWPFGLMVLGLAAIGAVVWLRRARES